MSRSARWCATRRPSARPRSRRHAPLIALAMPHIGHPAIRNRGTIGGSIAFADPAAELPACVLALGGEVEIAGPQGHARASRPTTSSRACSRPRSAPRDVLTAIRVPAARRRHARRLRRARAPPRRLRAWSAWPPARAPTASALARSCASPISASARRRCARAMRGAGAGGRRHRRGGAARSRRISIRPTTCRRSGAVKTHLAGVLLRRVARAARSEARHERTRPRHHPHRQRRGGRARRVEARKTLVDFLREDLGLTGSHVGCEHGVCGACTVRVDGEIVRGCLMLAVQCDGARGRDHRGRVRHRRDRRPAGGVRRSATRCSAAICTPGMLLTAQELLAHERACRRRERDPRAPLRQLLPLHRLSRHRRCGRERWRRRAREDAA